MYYGWYIVGGALLSQVAMIGFFTYVFSMLVMPLQAEFAASRTEVMYSMSLSTILGLFFAPAIGFMADKYPIRWLMSAGAVIFGVGLYLLSMTQTLTQFTILFGLVMAASNQLLGPICGTASITRWFTDNRGKALGLSATGSSFGGMLLPVLFVVWLGDNGDWRGALQNLSYGVLLLLLPYLVVFMRDAEAQVSEDKSAEGEASAAQPAETGYSLKAIVKHPAYWIVGLSMAVLFSTYSALLANLTPYVAGQNLEEKAAQVIMVLAVSGLIGKVLFGYVADKISLRLALSITQAAVISGLVLLAIEPSYPVIVVAIIITGLSTGGMLPVWSALLAAIFGTASYGRVMGLMMPLIVLIVMPGYSLAGYFFDKTGDYSLCFFVFSAAIAVSMPLLAFLKMPSQQK